MISAQNISKRYDTRPLFEKSGFFIGQGEKVGLVGRNGHGKTTLLRMLAGEETPDEGILSIPKDYRIGYLAQHIHLTKKTLLEEACLGLPENRAHEEWTVKKVLAGLGFRQEDMGRDPAEFSGGYQVRLCLAKVIVSEPDMLLLDEPTNFLDIVSIRWLIDYLKSWRRELVLVSHDRNFMDGIATHILGIHRQKIRKIQGVTGDYYSQIEKEEEVHENRRLNDEKVRQQMNQFISKFRAKARQAGLAQSRIKSLEKRRTLEKLDKIATLSFSFKSAPFEAKYLFEAENLTFSYEGKEPWLFDNLSFNLEKGDRLCVIGKNGKGKTTLLKTLSGKLSPLSGRIRMHPLIEQAYYEQANTAELNPHLCVEEEIFNASPNKERKFIRDICGAMMFSGDDALKKISVLSGGEKCRVLLGKLLVSPANLLILDEPTHHLDMESSEALIDSIDEFEGGVLMVTHNEHILAEVANKLIVFQNGKAQFFDGTYDEFLERVGWEDEKAALKADLEVEIPEAKVKREDLKKLRVEFIARRSKVLNPLKNTVEKLEKRIVALEEESTRTTEALVKASEEQNASAIAAHSKTMNVLKAETDQKYEELGEATERYEKEKKRFDEEEKEFQL